MTGLSDTSVAELGAALSAARRSGVPIEPHLSWCAEP